jgi:hypothetical protein
MRKRLDVLVDADHYEYVKDQSEQTGIPMNVIADELLSIGIAVKRGEVIEQQSLPVIREIVSTELRKQLAQHRSNLREDITLEVVNELKEVAHKGDNRLAAIMMRIARDGAIIRRLVYTLLAKAHGPDFAWNVYEDAKEKAGKELANRPAREKTEEES